MNFSNCSVNGFDFPSIVQSGDTIRIGNSTFQGSTLSIANGCITIDGQPINIDNQENRPLNVIFEKNVTCDSLQSDRSITIQGSVQGNITAGSSIKCGEVIGTVSAGSSVQCGEVKGMVTAGSSVQCGNVGQSVKAGSSIRCGDIKGDLCASSSVKCNNVGGSISASRVSCASCQTCRF